MIVTRTIVVAVLGLPFLVGFDTPQSKQAAGKRKVVCPDEVTTIGHFRNYSYGFSVSIPPGLKGLWNSARCVKDERNCVCLGDHGRFIPVDKNSYIEIFVRTENYETLRESIEEEVEWNSKRHKDEKELAEVVTRAPARLGGASATRLMIKYQDAKTGATMLEDIIIGRPVDRVHRGWLYLITLVTPDNVYARRKALLQSIVRSWKYRSRP
jgi:hypothetical protein